MVNGKKKGNAGENLFANWLQSEGIKAYRNSGSGAGIAKSDIHNGLNANLEVKTVKALNLKKAWEQSIRDSRLTHTTPYVIVHFDGMAPNKWLVVMDNHDWVEMLRLSLSEHDVVEVVAEDSREKKWALENLKNAINKTLKFI